jgi:hypothetical protein
MAVYVKNKDLLEQIRISKQQDELTPEALQMIIKMATNLSYKMMYKNPEDRKDCIAGAIMDVYMYWRNYDELKSNNAFAYFTQIIKNGYAKQWRHLHPQTSSSFIRITDNIWSI